MNKFSRIEELYHSALELAAAERVAFLDRECGDDEEIRLEVEQLLKLDDEGSDFMEQPPGDVAATLLNKTDERDLVGKTLNHYKVVAPLGQGGMGEVYLAEDTKLGRQAAIKLLPAIFSTDPDRKSRFENEARTVSALNHPNILTVYGIENALELDFIATEFIDGRTLRDLIADGPLPWTDVIEIGLQMAAALESAHRVGIIHRDIKPANVMRRPDGIVKILDFGLAKLSLPKGESGSFDTHSHTAPNRIMGTINYMSPEQALGEKVDWRTDIFSTGVVFYELLTGRQPFSGASDAAVYNATLNLDPPPISIAGNAIPEPLDAIVRRMLAKKPADRYESIADLKNDLELVRQSIGSDVSRGTPDGLSSGIAARKPAKKSWRSVAAIVSGMIGLAIVGGIVLRVLSSPAAPDFRGFNFSKTTSLAGMELFPTLSPDAKTVVYSAGTSSNLDIFSLRVGGKNPVNLTADSKSDDTQPAFSPDGEFIVFRSERDGGGIFVMEATGENPRRISTIGYNPTWSPDGREVAVSIEGITDWASRANDVSQLWVINVATGARRLLSNSDAVQPAWSPNGKFIAFWASDEKGQRDLGLVPAAGGDAIPITSDAPVDWNPVWSPDSRYLYFASDRGGNMNIWRLAIDPSSGSPQGKPEPSTIPSSSGQHFSFSRDGQRIVYVQNDSRNTVKRIGFDPQTEKVSGPSSFLIADRQVAVHPAVSPDGEWITFSSAGETREDVFIVHQDGTGLRQLTDDPGRDRLPRWSPDGKQIFDYSDRGGKYEIWSVRPDGSDLRVLTEEPGVTIRYPVFSPAGDKLAYVHGDEGTRIMNLSLPYKNQTVETVPPIDQQTVFEPWSWSPDGTYITGKGRVADGTSVGIFGFRPSDRSFRKLSDRGNSPIWLRDSRRLLYVEKDQLFVLNVENGKVDFVYRDESGSFDMFDIAPDNRTIYYGTTLAESDIWLGVAP